MVVVRPDVFGCSAVSVTGIPGGDGALRRRKLFGTRFCRARSSAVQDLEGGAFEQAALDSEQLEAARR